MYSITNELFFQLINTFILGLIPIIILIIILKLKKKNKLTNSKISDLEKRIYDLENKL